MSAALVARAAWGVWLLVAPGVVIRWVKGIDEPASRRVVRILGGRHLVQAALEARYGAAARRLGGVVDALHALTASGFAVADRRWRRPAIADAVVASAFALTARRRAG